MEYNEIDDYLIGELDRNKVIELLDNIDITPLLLFVEKREYNLENEIINLFKKMGIPCYLKGYNCLLRAISIMVKNKLNVPITRSLYPKIASELHIKVHQVEKNIRKAIEVTWDNINPDTIDKLFGYSISINKDHPTNSHFIITVSKYILKKHKRID